MTTTEMVYVLDTEKECIQRRADGKCQKECKGCQCYMEPSSLLDAFERIVNMIFNMKQNGTKRSY